MIIFGDSDTIDLEWCPTIHTFLNAYRLYAYTVNAQIYFKIFIFWLVQILTTLPCTTQVSPAFVGRNTPSLSQTLPCFRIFGLASRIQAGFSPQFHPCLGASCRAQLWAKKKKSIDCWDGRFVLQLHIYLSAYFSCLNLDKLLNLFKLQFDYVKEG